MRATNVQQYRLAALQTQLFSRLSDTAARLERITDLDETDIEPVVGKAVARFVQVIAPVVGPDTVSELPRPDDFVEEQRRSPLFPLIKFDTGSVSSTEFLLTFDDFGLLSAGVTTKNYPSGAIETLTGMLGEQIPSLASYLSTVQFLLSRPSIKRLFDETALNYFYEKADFAKVQALWSDAKTADFRECVRLLFFADDPEWSRRIEQLATLSDRIVLNPGLQLAPEDVDQMSWGLIGAAPLFPYDGSTSSTDIGWSATNKAAHFARSHNADSRASALVKVRGDLHRAAMEMTPDPGLNGLEGIIRNVLRQNLSRDDVRRDGPDGWSS